MPSITNSVTGSLKRFPIARRVEVLARFDPEHELRIQLSNLRKLSAMANP
jgi:hypothetical protein